MQLHLPAAIRLSLLAAAVWLGHAADAIGAEAAREVCPRPPAGGMVEEPEDLRSENGVLKVDLTVRNEKQPDGTVRFCYLLADGAQAPTLRLKPGDLLVLRLKNELVDTDNTQTTHVHGAHPQPGSDPCKSGVMSLTSANLHFHGLSIPPVCHQDEVFKTSVQPADPPFEYRFRIPENEPPGLYWYHPHIHGFSSKQVLGGASGALIVEGIERATPEVAGLPERVLVIRDQDLVNPDAEPSTSEPATQALIDRDGDAANNGTGWGKPAKDLSVNYTPVPYPEYPRATILMKPGERQLWRVLNASSVTYLNLTALFKRGAHFRADWLGVVAIDGVPLSASGSRGHAVAWRDSIVVSPGSRVEFIIAGPPMGVAAMLVTKTVDTGEAGENDPNRALVNIVAAAEAPSPHSVLPAASQLLAAPLPWIGAVNPVRVRKLYFSEDPTDPKNPSAAKFYLTVDGQTPAVFDPASTEPNIVVRQGDVEDWVIENRSNELHAFHIHQIHFQVRDWVGLTVNEPFVRDTVNVPFFDKAMKGYPSLTLRMDFRDPNSVGTFVFHCHLLDHEDGGMMGLIRVEPAAK
ncbi:MAG TPA: multicopper oxidase domain-containing protein [Steroidobacteraceae bacterium]|nr:multicopper oxidase domain-containing protein [Steroidobacteraceae bacterium]